MSETGAEIHWLKQAPCALLPVFEPSQSTGGKEQFGIFVPNEKLKN